MGLKRIVRSSITILISSALIGCSSGSSMFTQEGMMGSSFGLLAGTGAGYLIGQQIGKPTENMALAGGIGAGLGLLAGGLMHDRNLKKEYAKQAVVREAQLVSDNQKDIDDMRQRMQDSSTWGQGEVKSWNDRYWGESYDVPYEGPIGR